MSNLLIWDFMCRSSHALSQALDRRSGTENGSSLPAAVPSGPRAMSASDNKNPPKSSGPLRGYPARDAAPTREQARDSHRDVNGTQDVSRRDPGDRDNGPPRGLHSRDSSSRDQGGRGHRSGNPEDTGNGSGSLLSRVSDHTVERRSGDSPAYDNDHNRKRALEGVYCLRYQPITISLTAIQKIRMIPPPSGQGSTGHDMWTTRWPVQDKTQAHVDRFQNAALSCLHDEH
jgi:hypothetical protein